MIARLKGIIDSIGTDHIVLDVQGVGYLVQCAAKTLAQVPGVGEAMVFEIETRMRDDAIQLFGFATSDERNWFRLLQDVQGVGAKVALAILSTLTPADMAAAIATNDKAAFARSPGVGPKLAARLAMELKDKAPAPSFTVSQTARVQGAGTAQEAASALINLGYRQSDAERAVGLVLNQNDQALPIGQVIRLALRELAR